ncbi:HTTM domain-containing protein [Mycobacterium sp. URHB0044]|uniref:HTTM domain-containing protein n=1 Tax=Mycobacterium sp. URHB0044 TaxID=1380386 RepID=UPI0006858502|nr:HTTM domain-containing protein [Mycobacterium sp. URHB0044]
MIALALRGWRAFWFRPTRAYTLGLVRIAFGALIVVWTATLLPGLHDLFGPEGVASTALREPFRWTLFQTWSGDQALLVGWAVLLVAGLAMTVGWHSRLASVVVFVLVLSFQYRNPSAFNSGDVVIRAEALFLMLAPCGTALSLDQRRRTGSFWSTQIRAPWAIRLLQLQLSVIYLSSVRAKLSGHAWSDGTAVSYALRLYDMLLVPTPHAFSADPLFVNIATWSALAMELSLGILVWNKGFRPWVLAGGIVMHTTIALTINVGFFTPAMFVLYLAFVPPTAIRDLPATARRWTSTNRVSRHDRVDVATVHRHESPVVADASHEPR